MSELMPAAFIGHGSPMNALDHNRYTECWTEFASSIPKTHGRAGDLAHWFVNITAVTADEGPSHHSRLLRFSPTTL